MEEGQCRCKANVLIFILQNEWIAYDRAFYIRAGFSIH